MSDKCTIFCCKSASVRNWCGYGLCNYHYLGVIINIRPYIGKCYNVGCSRPPTIRLNVFGCIASAACSECAENEHFIYFRKLFEDINSPMQFDQTDQIETLQVNIVGCLFCGVFCKYGIDNITTEKVLCSKHRFNDEKNISNNIRGKKRTIIRQLGGCTPNKKISGEMLRALNIQKQIYGKITEIIKCMINFTDNSYSAANLD